MRTLARTIAAVLAFSLLAPGASAQVAIPNTPAGHILLSWLEAFNSGDPAKLEEYLKHNMPNRPARIEVILRKDNGGYDLVSIVRSDPHIIEFVLKERARPWEFAGFLRVNAATGIGEQLGMERFEPGAQVLGFGVDGETRRRTVERVIALLNEFYLSRESARRMAADLRARLDRGAFDSLTEGSKFTAVLTDALWSVSGDMQLRVTFSATKPPTARPAPEMPAQLRNELLRDNCSFDVTQRLPGNIGVLRIGRFPPPELCREIISPAMKSLADADAIMLDLRRSEGGSRQMMAHIASYFVDPPSRPGDAQTPDDPNVFWTSAATPATRLVKQPLYVLTSTETGGMVAELTYVLKARKRGTIVGETIDSRAGPLDTRMAIDDRFAVTMRRPRPINPFTGETWDGFGVAPDVKVQATDAFDAARALALEALSGNIRAR